LRLPERPADGYGRLENWEAGIMKNLAPPAHAEAQS